MPAPSQTVFDGFQSCRHPIPAGLSYQHEPAVAIFPADVREPEEVERFWFAFSPDGTVFGSEAAELHQTGFLRVNRESNSLSLRCMAIRKRRASYRLSNPMTMSSAYLTITTLPVA